MHVRDLFSLELDWLHPLLHEAARNPEEALARIRTHLSGFSLPLSRLDLCGDVLSQAEHLLERRLDLLNEAVTLDTPVNWHRLAGTDGQRNWHLGYMYWLHPLVAAYETTGDDRYARQWRVFVEEFIDDCPYAADARGYHPTRDMVLNDKKTCNLGENGGPRHAEAPPESRHQWMSLSCHFRIDSWLAGLTRLAASPELDDEFLAKVLLSLTRDHAFVCVMNPRENTPNQFTAVTLSLLRLSVVLPMFRSHAGHFLVAWERLQRVFSNTMYPDGSDAEQSPNYNLFLLDLCVELLDLLQEAPESRKAPIRNAAQKRLEFLEAIQTPDGSLPPIAKAHLAPLDERLTQARKSLDLPPAPSPAECCHFPYGGYHVLRSETSWLLFKHSPAGNGHMHEDCLSFQLWLNEKEVLTDPSHYTYEMKDPEERSLNEWALSTGAHNSVLVNGEGQRRIWLRHHGTWKDDEVPDLKAGTAPPLPDRIGEHEAVRFLEGTYSEGYPGTETCRHTRQIVEVKEAGWLILDWLSEPVEATRCWQFAPALTGSLEVNGDRVDGPALHMQNLSSDTSASVQNRFHFPEYAVRVPAREVRWNSPSIPGTPLLSWISASRPEGQVLRNQNRIDWGRWFHIQWEQNGAFSFRVKNGTLSCPGFKGSILWNGEVLTADTDLT